VPSPFLPAQHWKSYLPKIGDTNKETADQNWLSLFVACTVPMGEFIEAAC
jgi:hypothetical protein